MIVLTILIFVIYYCLISAFIVGFNNIKIDDTKFEQPITKFSIIIPFRNETANLDTLLQSLLNLKYPKELFEILLINDASEDNSCEIIKNFQQQHPSLKIIVLQNCRKTASPKKDAINTAIKTSNFNWLVTTDADCEVPKNWLHCFNSSIQKNNPVFMSAPVKFKKESTFLFHFQNLNLISLIGSTIGGFGIKKAFLCNGANLCYRKNIFKSINGFEGNSAIASGDDVFLLEKMIENYPKKTIFLKSKKVIVSTKSESNWKVFFNQQLRWASKTTSYTNWFSKLVGFAVFTTNLTILIVGTFLLFNPTNWEYYIALFLCKIFFDFILIEKTAQFLNTKNSLIYYPLISLLYPFYIVITAFASVLKKYEWKGRMFKK